MCSLPHDYMHQCYFGKGIKKYVKLFLKKIYGSEDVYKLISVFSIYIKMFKYLAEFFS